MVEEIAGAKEALIQQAKKMKRDSDAKFQAPEVGMTVRVPILDVDRGKSDDRSILARVQRVTENDLYELGTKYGVLQQLYSRSQFTVCSEKFVEEADVPKSAPISLRSAATKQSEEKGGHGQGFVRCQCTQKCDSKRCSCRRKGLQYNSKCHGSKSCCNK